MDGLGFLSQISLFCSIWPYTLVRLDHTAYGCFNNRPSAPAAVEALVHRAQALLVNIYDCNKIASACDRYQDAAGNDRNLRCESRMDRKSLWGWSQISEWIARDER